VGVDILDSSVANNVNFALRLTKQFSLQLENTVHMSSSAF
jgi:hypothetical protein